MAPRYLTGRKLTGNENLSLQAIKDPKYVI
jgi:hypothetical protein